MNDGIILADKPRDVTSRDIVNRITKIFKTDKAGHTGSLDPFATGLLVITLNKGTKAGPFIEAYEKTYVATLKLGEKKDTGDLTGKTIETSPVITMYEPYVTDVLESFLGKSLQVPPMYSALKKDGIPLYKLAREGVEIEREGRGITISAIRLLTIVNHEITFEATVSKGTYIRTLGEDIASKMGMVGHLVSLRRTKVGPFDVKDAKKIGDITTQDVISVYEALSQMPKIIVKDEMIKDIYAGKALKLPSSEEQMLLVSANKAVLAVYKKKEDGLFYSVRGLF